MGLITEEVEIGLNNTNIKHFENLGYEIPRYKDSHYRYVVKEGTKIIVKTSDLLDTSTISIIYECDSCGDRHNIGYGDYKKSIRDDGKKFCFDCCRNGLFYSLGQWMIDNNLVIEKYWSIKNKIDPFFISYGSETAVIYIKCQNKSYHEDYNTSCNTFTQGNRCPYCASSKLNIMDSLGYLYPKSISVWSKKNAKTPYDYFPKTNQYFIWDCEIHGEYSRLCSNAIKYDFRCQKCSKDNGESLIQTKVRNYLENMKYIILHERECTLKPKNPKTNMPLRYDNEILNLKLIIEVHGQQHYDYGNYYRSMKKIPKNEAELKFKELQFRDNYKKQFALDNGYYFLEIPYWTDNKNNDWKLLIDNKIKEIEGE